MRVPEHIVLSRTDSIGDVMLTLPMAGVLKQRFPGVRISFIGRRYTRPVLACCAHVDEVLTLEELQAGDPVAQLRAWHADVLIHVFPRREVASWARQARIPLRIGTSHRWWHWITCTHRVAFSRRRSELHEAQLNLKLLAPLGFTGTPSLAELAGSSGFHAPAPDATVQALLQSGKRHVLLHPLSQGSAVEWGLERFATLIQMLDPSRYQAIITGTQAEAERYRKVLPVHVPHVTDAGGTLTLEQLIALIGAGDALVAASTGPLHIAAACGIRAVGLYAPKRPIHPGRWAPIGTDVHALVNDPACARCAAGQDCDCITRIAPERVLALLG
ncbi:MAG: glycosyltransferase family 9 protein [Flavobacteriales bacterium]|nr:glycosyltransferase family 9 protein [Flavobacteriales bacterium]